MNRIDLEKELKTGGAKIGEIDIRRYDAVKGKYGKVKTPERFWVFCEQCGFDQTFESFDDMLECKPDGSKSVADSLAEAKSISLSLE